MQLYNTLTRKTDTLKPLEDNLVKIYTCGLTVYSQPHIGNWVGYIYWDILIRTLMDEGFKVDRTQNITDVGHLTSDDDNGEDKMEKGARREGLTAWDVAKKYSDIAEHEAYDLLGLLRPNHLVPATSLIDQQIAFVQALEAKGYTYEIPDEGIYFDTAKLDHYGQLARLDIAGLEAGARVSVEGKRHITDFAVWKFSPKDQQRDMEWDSPWGKGFPGWHLECSVIARETLGDQIDIHTGGIDHIPVHHTNEIAQTEAVTGKQFSQFWVHNNHLKVDGGKMSKSLGNIYTLEDIQNHGYSLAAFKVFILSKHYRTEGNFTWDNLSAAANRLKDLQAFADLRFQAGETGLQTSLLEMTQARIRQALRDDLNTPEVLTQLSELADKASVEGISMTGLGAFESFLNWLDDILGLGFTASSDITAEQKSLLQKRTQARATNDWATSDQIRDELSTQGIGVRDTPRGAVWFRL